LLSVLSFFEALELDFGAVSMATLMSRWHGAGLIKFTWSFEVQRSEAALSDRA